jgi:hypothetical protein
MKDTEQLLPNFEDLEIVHVNNPESLAEFVNGLDISKLSDEIDWKTVDED